MPAKVSVILPNYNHANYLPRRIESILGQTFQDFELLILDDCSPDESRSVIARYEDHPKVRTLFNDTNSGSTFKQWNKGVAATSGEYIWLAESDDYADVNLLQRLVAVLEENPRVGVAFCQSNVIDANDNVLRTTLGHYDDLGQGDRWTRDFVSDGRQECAESLSQKNIIPNASAAVFRRKLYQDVGGADESMRLCGDWKMWAAMLLRGDLGHVAQPLNYFRFHTQNVRTATRSWQPVIETARAVQFVGAGTEIPPERLRSARKRLADQHINAMLGSGRNDKAGREKAEEELRRFDPAFRRRIVGQYIARSIALIGKGKVTHWLGRLGRGVIGR